MLPSLLLQTRGYFDKRYRCSLYSRQKPQSKCSSSASNEFWSNYSACSLGRTFATWESLDALFESAALWQVWQPHFLHQRLRRKSIVGVSNTGHKTILYLLVDRLGQIETKATNCLSHRLSNGIGDFASRKRSAYRLGPFPGGIVGTLREGALGVRLPLVCCDILGLQVWEVQIRNKAAVSGL